MPGNQWIASKKDKVTSNNFLYHIVDFFVFTFTTQNVLRDLLGRHRSVKNLLLSKNIIEVIELYYRLAKTVGKKQYQFSLHNTHNQHDRYKTDVCTLGCCSGSNRRHKRFFVPTITSGMDTKPNGIVSHTDTSTHRRTISTRLGTIGIITTWIIRVTRWVNGWITRNWLRSFRYRYVHRTNPPRSNTLFNFPITLPNPIRYLFVIFVIDTTETIGIRRCFIWCTTFDSSYGVRTNETGWE